MIVRELITKLGFKTDMGKLKKFSTSLLSIKGLLIAGVGAATTYAGSALAMAKSAANAAEHLKKMSLQSGLGIKEIQKLSYASELAGISQEDLSLKLITLSRNINEARKGSKETQKIFSKIGINPNRLKNSQDAIFQISDIFQKMPDGIKKTALAQDLFGKSGFTLIPLLNKGSEAIKKQGIEAEKLGFFFEKGTTEKAAQLNDTLFKMKFAFAGIKNFVGSALIPIFADLFNTFLTWLEANKEFIKLKLTTVLTEVASLLKFLIESFANAESETSFFIVLFKTFISLIKISTWVVGKFFSVFGNKIVKAKKDWAKLKEAWAKVKDVFGPFFDFLGEGFQKILDIVTWIKDSVMSIVGEMKEAKKVFDQIRFAKTAEEKKAVELKVAENRRKAKEFFGGLFSPGSMVRKNEAKVSPKELSKLNNIITNIDLKINVDSRDDRDMKNISEKIKKGIKEQFDFQANTIAQAVQANG